MTRENSFFVCTPNIQNITISQLCDGHANCDRGEDETTTLCESEFISYEQAINTLILLPLYLTTDKCLIPYYGGCSYTRECITSEFDVNCGGCLPGFVENPANTAGDCLGEYGTIIPDYLQNKEYVVLLSVP